MNNLVYYKKPSASCLNHYIVYMYEYSYILQEIPCILSNPFFRYIQHVQDRVKFLTFPGYPENSCIGNKYSLYYGTRC